MERLACRGPYRTGIGLLRRPSSRVRRHRSLPPSALWPGLGGGETDDEALTAAAVRGTRQPVHRQAVTPPGGGLSADDPPPRQTLPAFAAALIGITAGAFFLGSAIRRYILQPADLPDGNPNSKGGRRGGARGQASVPSVQDLLQQHGGASTAGPAGSSGSAAAAPAGGASSGQQATAAVAEQAAALTAKVAASKPTPEFKAAAEEAAAAAAAVAAAKAPREKTAGGNKQPPANSGAADQIGSSTLPGPKDAGLTADGSMASAAVAEPGSAAAAVDAAVGAAASDVAAAAAAAATGSPAAATAAKQAAEDWCSEILEPALRAASAAKRAEQEAAAAAAAAAKAAAHREAAAVAAGPLLACGSVWALTQQAANGPVMLRLLFPLGAQGEQKCVALLQDERDASALQAVLLGVLGLPTELRQLGTPAMLANVAEKGWAAAFFPGGSLSAALAAVEDAAEQLEEAGGDAEEAGEQLEDPTDLLFSVLQQQALLLTSQQVQAATECLQPPEGTVAAAAAQASDGANDEPRADQPPLSSAGEQQSKQGVIPPSKAKQQEQQQAPGMDDQAQWQGDEQARNPGLHPTQEVRAQATGSTDQQSLQQSELQERGQQSNGRGSELQQGPTAVAAVAPAAAEPPIQQAQQAQQAQQQQVDEPEQQQQQQQQQQPGDQQQDAAAGKVDPWWEEQTRRRAPAKLDPDWWQALPVLHVPQLIYEDGSKGLMTVPICVPVSLQSVPGAVHSASNGRGGGGGGAGDGSTAPCASPSGADRKQAAEAGPEGDQRSTRGARAETGNVSGSGDPVDAAAAGTVCERRLVAFADRKDAEALAECSLAETGDGTPANIQVLSVPPSKLSKHAEANACGVAVLPRGELAVPQGAAYNAVVSLLVDAVERRFYEEVLHRAYAKMLEAAAAAAGTAAGAGAGPAAAAGEAAQREGQAL